MRLYVYFAFLGLVQLLLLFTNIWELAERHALLQSSLLYVNFFAGQCIKFVKCAHCLFIFYSSILSSSRFIMCDFSALFLWRHQCNISFVFLMFCVFFANSNSVYPSSCSTFFETFCWYSGWF